MLEGHLPAITPLHCLDAVVMPQGVYDALPDVAKAQLDKLLPKRKIILVADGATAEATSKACTREALKHACGSTPIRPGYCFTIKQPEEYGAPPREHLLPTRVPRDKFCLTLLCVLAWLQRVAVYVIAWLLELHSQPLAHTYVFHCSWLSPLPCFLSIVIVL